MVKFEQALNDNFSTQKSQLSLFAVPYFFSAVDVVSPNLTYNWFTNGSPAKPSELKNIFNLITDGTGGEIKMDLSIEDKTKLFQSAKSSTILNFNK